MARDHDEMVNLPRFEVEDAGAQVHIAGLRAKIDPVYSGFLVGDAVCPKRIYIPQKIRRCVIPFDPVENTCRKDIDCDVSEILDLNGSRALPDEGQSLLLGGLRGFI